MGGWPLSTSISLLCRSVLATGSGWDQGNLWGVSVEAYGSRVWSTELFPAKGAERRGPWFFLWREVRVELSPLKSVGVGSVLHRKPMGCVGACPTPQVKKGTCPTAEVSKWRLPYTASQ